MNIFVMNAEKNLKNCVRFPQQMIQSHVHLALLAIQNEPFPSLMQNRMGEISVERPPAVHVQAVAAVVVLIKGVI